MQRGIAFCALLFVLLGTFAEGHAPQVDARVLRKTADDTAVTLVHVAVRFVTTISLPDPVNSIVLGDPSNFQVEHSEREPKLVFVKAISKTAHATNLLISTTVGRQFDLLLVNRGDHSANVKTVDFLVRYGPSADFLVPSRSLPFALVGATVPLWPVGNTSATMSALPSPTSALDRPALSAAFDLAPLPRSGVSHSTLDHFLEEQESAPLPVLYGGRIGRDRVTGDQVLAGVGRVIDGGQQVIVLFSVVNPTRHAILLMPPQVQLGGRINSGRVIRHTRWTTAEQLPVEDSCLSRRRLGLGERADGVVVFERPPYKQSNEGLFLQVAQAGAVDRPALAPIGFGVNTMGERANGR